MDLKGKDHSVRSSLTAWREEQVECGHCVLHLQKQ